VLNVESGLNDGIATPIVWLAIAGVAAEESVEGAPSLGGSFLELAIGLAVGIIAGLVAGAAMVIARRRGWASEDFAGPAVLAAALATLQAGAERAVAAVRVRTPQPHRGSDAAGGGRPG
jgi:NhaP-type Na+/H+ or K+/H+ antiporter